MMKYTPFANLQTTILPNWPGLSTFSLQFLLGGTGTLEDWHQGLWSLQESSQRTLPVCLILFQFPDKSRLLISALAAISHNEETRNKPASQPATHNQILSGAQGWFNFYWPSHLGWLRVLCGTKEFTWCSAIIIALLLCASLRHSTKCK